MPGPLRWCVKCQKAMRSYNGATGAGMCWGCHHNQPRHRMTDYTDDPPAVIEAKFQAALRDVKRSRRLSADVPWESSLTRFAWVSHE